MFSNKYFFKLIVLLLVVTLYASSCSPKVIRGLDMYKGDAPSAYGLLDIDNIGQINYRCKLEAFDQKMSGVFIFKKQKNEDVRAVMITDFGLKVVDISFHKNGEYTVHHIMKHMDYEFVKESFALNILMLLPKSLNSDLMYFQKENKTLIFAPHLKMIYYLNAHHKTKMVERYRGKTKLVAVAEIHENGSIKIDQFNPIIEMTLIPISNADR